MDLSNARVAASAATENGKIVGVSVGKQKEVKIFSAHVPARQLIELCRVERFQESGNGVQRRLREDRVLVIATGMADPKSVWLEPLIGDLQGVWEFDENTQTLSYESGAYISIDDGQHRLYALCSGVLSEDELDKLVFPLTVTRGLTYEQRLRVFRMQSERLAIDARLDLAQRDVLGDWKNELDAEAYKLTVALNAEPSSPLYAKIQVEEGDRKPHASRASKEAYINARGLYTTIRSIISRRSPLYTLTPELRKEVIVNMLRAAKTTWPTAWASKVHVLASSRGVCAILRLFVTGTNFRATIGADFSYENLVKTFKLAPRFDWTTVRFVQKSTDQMLLQLDQSILRGWQNRQGPNS